MAVGRTLQHRVFSPGVMNQTPATRRFKRRHLALALLAMVAGVLASFSLAFNPSEQPPPNTSYLPDDAPPTP